MIPQEPAAKGKQPELLQRRESRSVVPRLPVWSDHRAWITSCLAHTLVFLALALLWQPRTRGTGATIERPVGIAVVHESSQGDEYFLHSGARQGGVEPASAASSSQRAAREDSGPPISVSDLMSELVGAAGENPDPNAADQGTGEGLAGLGTATTGAGTSGGETSTTFMGLKGTGASFVYVLDRSASMAEFNGAPMQFAKRELLRSIQSLEDKHQFQIVFYNETPGALNPGTAGGRMLNATETNKDRASSFVRAISPQGGTEHLPGLKMALSYGPAVLFFLTDAAEPSMTESQLLDIQDKAERSLTTIHTVQFNQGAPTNDGGWIRDLAEMNRGTYRYVDILTIE